MDVPNVNYTALFNNLPTGKVFSPRWNFPGAASVNALNSPGPSVTYADTGCFDVELITVTQRVALIPSYWKMLFVRVVHPSEWG